MVLDFERRRGLTFAQSEGAVPLPTQLDRKTIPSELRARVWAIVYEGIMHDRFREGVRVGHYSYRLNVPWHKFWQEKRVKFDHKMIADSSYNVEMFIDDLKKSFSSEDYIVFYGIIQFMLRSYNIKSEIKEQIETTITDCLSPYRVVGGDTLVPFGSAEELEAFQNAGATLSNLKMPAPLAHLRRSAVFLGEGKFSDSIRESISAIESIVRNIDSGNNVASALNSLSKSNHIHPSMNEAFKRLYGYASDEQGIRHALLDDGDAKVTEADAMFMLGACASFATYLITNARNSGLL